MSLIHPLPGAYVGTHTRLAFATPLAGLDITVDGSPFHAVELTPGLVYDLALTDVPAGVPIVIAVTASEPDGTTWQASVQVSKPAHDTAGMGATLVRAGDGTVLGTFFKFWLPRVAEVYVRGSFNSWQDIDRLEPLGDSGYWYGFAETARPGDDYRFFVYTHDQRFNEVSDPAARRTKKTRYNSADSNDANAVICDPQAFVWRHDGNALEARRDARRLSIYQCHWGTFLRPDGSYVYEPFTRGATEDERRQALRDKLALVVELGFTAIQLLPVHEANGPTNAGYDPSFFFAIETTYGTPEDLQLLVDEAHGLGLAVILDAVINHLTDDDAKSSFCQEFLKGWYVRSDAPWSNSRQWGGRSWGSFPDWGRPEIRNLLGDCLRMYLLDFHVDGIRMDATTTIPVEALQELIGGLRADPRTAGAFTIAEHLTEDALAYAVGRVGFRAAWCKPAFTDCVGPAVGVPGRGGLDALRRICETSHAGDGTTAIKYTTGSHDEVWVSHDGQACATRFGGSGSYLARMKMRLAWSLSVCAVGVPMLFMGSECLTDIAWHEYDGFNGGTVHTHGAGLDWRPAPASHAGRFRHLVQTLNALRLAHGALRGGNDSLALVHRDDLGGVLAYRRWDAAGDVLLIVINLSDRTWNARDYRVGTGLPGSRWYQLFDAQHLDFGGWFTSPTDTPEADGQGLLAGIDLPAWSLLILKLV